MDAGNTFYEMRQVNFGTSKSGLDTVGYTLVDHEGTQNDRVTEGVHEVGTGTGIYAAHVCCPTMFKGSILWDTGEGSDTVYAAEQVMPIAEQVHMSYEVNAGVWHIEPDTKQMVFYDPFRGGEVIRFQLLDRNGNPSFDEVFERARILPDGSMA
jgi:hypothetical protein